MTNIRRPAYRRLAVVDVEATCGQGEGFRINQEMQEIIELPCVIVDTERAEIVTEFDAIVRPTEIANLTPFCTQLTGITQHAVDKSAPLAEALRVFDDFVRFNCPDGSFCVATDGPWDVAVMLAGECSRKGIKPAPHWNKFFDVRTEFMELYYPDDVGEPLPLADMLSSLGMKFEGRRHRGIDDARNIARVACAILRDDMQSRSATDRLGCQGSFLCPVLTGGVPEWPPKQTM
jgi:inhibitor of KinA sporulation pathway (predicted exonuclease)